MKVVIFGIRDFAELAHFYLEKDSEHEVVGFTVHAQYLPEDRTFRGLPVVPFEDLEVHFPPREHALFAPMSHRGMNRDREGVYRAGKARGYGFVSYVSSRASVFSDVGENCFILEDNTIQPFVKIGDNVVMWSGNHIGHHSVIEDHVFFTSHVVLSGHCVVGAYSFFGVNATIRDGLRLGEGTLVAMGALVTGDTEPWGVYKGSPAKISSVKSDQLRF